MTPEERELLIAAAAAAHREVDPFTRRPQPSPAWADLDADGRREAFEVTARVRALEAALDPEHLSSSARAVLRRIRNPR